METVKANGCKHLMYDKSKLVGVKIALLAGDRAVIERRDVDGNLQLCQLCSLRGRMNSAIACTSKSDAGCQEYEAHVHEIPVEMID